MRNEAVVVADVEGHGDGRRGREEDVDAAPKAEVLRPLADVERELGLATAGVATVNLDDPVLQGQSRQGSIQRLIAEHGDVAPALDDVGFEDRALGLGRVGGLLENRLGVGALNRQVGRHARLVVNLDEEDAPTSLMQDGRGGARGRLHPALGVDLDPDKARGIQNLLDHPRRLRLVVRLDRAFDPRLLHRRERPAENIQRLDHAPNLSAEGLKFNVRHNGKLVGPRR